MRQQPLAVQLRIAARRVWASMPLGMRFKIALHRMLAEIYKGIGEAITVILGDHGFNVPRDARGRVDTKDPAVANLSSAIFQKVMGVVSNKADAEDSIHETFTKKFLEQKTFLKLRGDTFADYRGWILTVFHNGARDYVVSKGRREKRQVDIEDAPREGGPTKDQRDRHRMLEMVESQLREQQRVPWERHPMWRQIKKDVYRALGEFDRQGKDPRSPYDFPTKRVFELMVVEGMSAAAAARRLTEEGLLEADPHQVKDALKRFKNRLEKVVQTTVKAIEDHELLDSFFSAIAA